MSTDSSSDFLAGLSAACAALPGRYLLLTPDLRIAAVSDDYLAATGPTRPELIGASILDVFRDDAETAGLLRASLQRVCDEGTADTLHIAPRHGGPFADAFRMTVTHAAIRDAGGRIAGLLHQVRDDDDRAMQALQRRIEECTQDLERFSHSVSHDLMTPLRAIDGYARMIEEDHTASLDEDGRRKLAVVREAAAQMNRMMDALLAHSRLGRTPVALRRLPMTEMTHTAFEDAASQASPAPRLALSPLPDACGDADLMRKAWRHLLDNAVRFTAHRPDASIAIGSLRQQDETVYFVKDNGAGFDMQYRDRLFGLFQRLHGTDEFPGMGTGLALAHRIVRRHGGRIWAEGETGKGATFYFTLPAMRRFQAKGNEGNARCRSRHRRHGDSRISLPHGGPAPHRHRSSRLSRASRTSSPAASANEPRHRMNRCRQRPVSGCSFARVDDSLRPAIVFPIENARGRHRNGNWAYHGNARQSFISDKQWIA